jgi:hypothetical protein
MSISSRGVFKRSSVHEFLDGVLDGLDLALQLLGLICGHASSNDQSRNTTCPPQCNIRWHKDIRDVLCNKGTN